MSTKKAPLPESGKECSRGEFASREIEAFFRSYASAAEAMDASLVGVDLLPADVGTWGVLEVNGAVDFN